MRDIGVPPPPHKIGLLAELCDLMGMERGKAIEGVAISFT